MKVKAILGLLLALAVAGSARADIIDFSTGAAPDNGTITYDGLGGALIGSNIGIGLVRGVGTPSNDGVADTITNGILSFTTGNFVSYNAGVYTFGGGGTITITGSGPGCTTIGGCGGNTPDTTSGPNLLTGSVVSASYTDAGTLSLALVNGSDIKDPLLVQFFGLDPATTTFQFSGTVHASTTSGGGRGPSAFTAVSTASTDISNATVPDNSSTLLLLALASAGMALAVRRFA